MEKMFGPRYMSIPTTGRGFLRDFDAFPFDLWDK
jgi:hypothetical protein